MHSVSTNNPTVSHLLVPTTPVSPKRGQHAHIFYCVLAFATLHFMPYPFVPWTSWDHLHVSRKKGQGQGQLVDDIFHCLVYSVVKFHFSNKFKMLLKN